MSTPGASAPLTFVVNERVLCYHGPLVYEAKVLKTTVFDETTTLTGVMGPHYFVHYKGWKQTWDEWVPGHRLLKLNETNIALQKQLQASNAPSAQSGSTSAKVQNKSVAGGSIKDGASTRAGARKDGTRGTKRAREEDESSRKPDIRFNVPEILKVKLVDDWEAVTKNNQLVSLPRSPTVAEILTSFSDHVLKTKPPHIREPGLVLPTILSGLQCYFDRALGANLLYRFERPQYAEIRKQYWTGPKVVAGQEKEMSQIYGAEHLLRMLVSLPNMIASSSLDAESVHLVRDYVSELLLYMVHEQEKIFLTEYESASLAYQSISRS
ncbi:uncharacterized protein LACBIDRAFT_297214 [Laccaria bicolor S238N-H82]|uniref:Chromatin modification-related protein EAF3 n=1 Tax=Laccaria bicolor (strain S238N-H82 / ATCC MYA-4686) TaxID=486041 RepID=B0DA97_LACBS|nr:uncharacterized protein LACBIDRAFT_297214 [Laccaria bicolor S238N-H82]EDR08717.1 predicted protein [Laccaria bicolor S238N-H82]|eukprot:XP_001880942.1 predicted protein [Laccaria bicolor S238N-H82]